MLKKSLIFVTLMVVTGLLSGINECGCMGNISECGCVECLEISGEVVDAETEEALSDVEVTLDGELFKTKEDGQFSFPDLEFGKHEIIARKDGYEGFSATIEISQDSIKINISSGGNISTANYFDNKRILAATSTSSTKKLIIGLSGKVVQLPENSDIPKAYSFDTPIGPGIWPVGKCPLAGKWCISLDFGDRNPNYQNPHGGEDWNLDGEDDIDKPVYAIADGQVMRVIYKSGYGYAVFIKHVPPKPISITLRDGKNTSTNEIFSGYIHLGKLNSIIDNAYEKVKNRNPPGYLEDIIYVEKGAEIGRIGPKEENSKWSGHKKTGVDPHLHFEISKELPRGEKFGYYKDLPVVDPSDFIKANANLTEPTPTPTLRLTPSPTPTPSPAQPVITQSPRLVQSPPYMVGQLLTATFTIKNKGGTAITFTELTAGGRLNGVDDCSNTGYVCPDFTKVYSITLNPGDSYFYQGTFTPAQPGDYQFQVFYLENGQWKWNVPAENGVSNSISITVTPAPILKWPLNGKPDDRVITQGFGVDWVDNDGKPIHPCGSLHKKHTGIDIDSPDFEDEPVYASAGGKVYIGNSDPGSIIVIEHNGFTTAYHHVDPLVLNGETVIKGQKIATIHKWVYQHLHYGVRTGVYSNISKRGGLPQVHGDSDFDNNGEFTGCKTDPVALHLIVVRQSRQAGQ